MIDIEQLRAICDINPIGGRAMDSEFVCDLEVGTLRALLDELASLRAAVVPKMMCDDQTLADAVRAAARTLNPHDIDMELELAAQHIEAGRVVTCDPFFYQIDNERLEAENKALRAANQWLPIADAPGDGTDLLVKVTYRIGGDEWHTEYWVDWQIPDDAWPVFRARIDIPFPPTHYRRISD